MAHGRWRHNARHVVMPQVMWEI